MQLIGLTDCDGMGKVISDYLCSTYGYLDVDVRNQPGCTTPAARIAYMDAFVEQFKKSRERVVDETYTKAMRKMIGQKLGLRKGKGGPTKLAPLGHKFYEDHPGLIWRGIETEEEARWVRNVPGLLWHIVLRGGTMGLELMTGDKILIHGFDEQLVRTATTLMLRGESIVNTVPSEGIAHDKTSDPSKGKESSRPL